MNDSSPDCPFCHLDGRRILAENDRAFAMLDRYPISNGHALVISRTHAANLFDLPEAELAGVFQLLAEVQRIVAEQYIPDGFNVGINIGHAAGQTVMHAHIHVIPRYNGDVAAPTGGVRGVIPGKATY